MPGLGLLAAGIGLAAYSLLSWVLMAAAPERAWTVLALFGPLLAGLTLAGWQRRHGLTLLGCALLALLLLATWWRGGVDVNRLYVLQHMAIHAVLGWGFAITLRAGETPMITQLASRVHSQPLSAAERLYTRRSTWGWMLYFFGMIALSLMLYFATPWAWWSFYCTVLTPAMAVTGFIGEHLWRRWRYPEFERVSMRSAMRSWRERSQHP